MLARLTRHPFDSPNHLFELKWDGIRALAFVDGGTLRLQGRNLQDLTPEFPELRGLPGLVKANGTVLDGELVCFDREGHPSLARMQERLRRQARGRAQGPRVNFVAFDLLYLNGASVLEEPLGHRKNLLHDILEPSGVAQACQFIERDGRAFFQATCDLGLEGVMAKDKDSHYLAGKRSTGWLKVKRVRECEFVIGGYTFGGNQGEPFSSLLLGLYDDTRRLVFLGQVGTGFSRGEARQIHADLQRLHTSDSPFLDPPDLQKFIYWCRPELVCRVEYGEFSTRGRLHYAVYQTLRDDKPAADCRTVDAPGWPLDLMLNAELG